MTANNVTLDEQIVYLQEQYMTHAEIHGESEPTLEAILATLQSIKDAGDDVVEPTLWAPEKNGNMMPVARDERLVEYVWHEDYKKLQSAYKRACVERDTHYNRLAGLLFSGALDSLTGNEAQKYAAEYVNQRERAEKAEAERDEFRKDAEALASRMGCLDPSEDNEICGKCICCRLTKAAIDGARNK